MKFSDLVGQESVTRAISNAIKLGRAPHGVIFSGVRGIGKTTTARLYAKALNCEDTSTQEPCNECTSCLAITKGNHEDVIELCTQIVDQNQGFVKAYVLRGFSLKSTGQEKAAQKDFQAALSLEPNNELAKKYLED